MADSVLGITVKAKDETTGPVGQAVKAMQNAANAVDGANAKIVQSEKAKKDALKAAAEAQKAAQKSAADLSTALGSLRGAIEIAGKQAGLTARDVVLLDVGFRAASAAAGALVDAGRAVVGVIGDTIEKSAKFGYKMAEVSTLVNTTEVDIGALSKVAKQLAGEFGQTPIDEARALYQAISSGAFEARDAISVMTVANRLAVAGVTDVFTALDGLTSVVNAYGGSMRGAQPYADAMFVAMRDGKTTISELASGIGNVAPTARIVGLTFDEVAASIAAITKGGIKTDEAVTALNQALVKLVKPGKDTRDEAHRLGIEFSAAGVAAAGGFAPFLRQITENSKLTSESIGKLFGNVRGIKGAFALTADSLKNLIEIMGHMNTKAGRVDEGLAKINNTVEQQAKRFGALRESIQISLGEMITGSETAKGAMLGLNEALTIVLTDLLETDSGMLGTKESMQKLARDGVATLLDGLANIAEALPNIGVMLLSTAVVAEKMARPLINMARAVSYVATAINDSAAAYAEEDRVIKGVSTSAIRSAEEQSKVAALLRKMADDVRANRKDAKTIEIDEKQAIEVRKKDLAEIKRLHDALVASMVTGSKAKKAADREMDQAVKEFREREKTQHDEAIKQLRDEEIAAKATASQMALDRRMADESEAAAEAQKMERTKRAQEEAAAMNKRTAQIVGSSLVGALDAIIVRGQDVGEVLKDMAIRMAEMVAEMLVIKAISAALGTTGIGGAVASFLGFGAADGGLMTARGPVRMADGGILSGGTPGRDSIPVLAMPGEAFIPRELVGALRRVLAVPSPQTHFAAGDVVAAGAGGGGGTLVFAPTYSQSSPMTSAQELRHYRDTLVPAMRRLMDGGHLDFMTARRR